MIDVESLIAPVTPDSPCGPNLEYDPAFVDLAQVAEGTPERGIGDTIEPAKDPDWLDVQQRANALFVRTKDLRVALLLTRALLRTEQLAGLSVGLTVIAELLTRYWDGLHPVIEPDDNDPTARLNALASLASGERGDPSGLLRDVWNTPVAVSLKGRVAVRDILVAKNLLQAGAGTQKMGADELANLLREAAANGPLPIEATQKTVQALDTIRSSLAAKVNSADIPNLQTLTGALIAVVDVLGAASGVGTAQANTGDTSGAAVLSTGGGTELHGREDVVRQLERICEFIQRTEPGNPAPLLIRRAQRLMTKDFLGIIKDLAPGSLDEIQKIAGIE